MSTSPPPLQLLIGEPGHGVVGYASDVASALRRADNRATVASAADVAEGLEYARRAPRVHLHVTDRLLGRSPEEAADNLERLAGVTRLTITVHDVPQTSDGTVLPRRIAAYTRFLGAAEAVVVNSKHEQQLVGEFLPHARAPHAIPLGARVRTAAARAAAGPAAAAHAEGAERAQADLAVLIAGYVYPGKGHTGAIRAAAAAARALREAGEAVGDVVVQAIGKPSPGHERDVEALRADAEALGVRFEVTGFLDDDTFARRMLSDGIPLAAHEHVSASRSMLDWVEAGRRPLVIASRYAHEMTQLRPDTMRLYDPADLHVHLAEAWREPARTWLRAGAVLTPTLDDVAHSYLAWWASADSS